MALYSPGAKRWTMTERSRASVKRSARQFVIGPSRLEWDGTALTIHIDEVSVPIPHRVRGTVRVFPQRLFNFSVPLDDGERHHWGPLAPSARVEVALDKPGTRWSGHGYLDSNEGIEPIERPFTEWDWSRSSLRDGSSAVIYDVRQKFGDDRVLALRFTPAGAVEPFDAPPRQSLPRTRWRIARCMRSDTGASARVTQTLEDTPFYARSMLESRLLGESVVSVHETLNVPRLVSPAVRFMLPWRMPRVR